VIIVAARSRGAGAILAATLLAWAPPSLAERPPGPDAGPADGQREARPSLFISPVGQPFRAGPGEPYPVARWFAQVDRNGDGRIDRAEFLADAEVFFHALDTNRDGVVDGFEVSNYEHNVVPEILGAYRAPAGDGQGEAHARRGPAPGDGPDGGGRKRGRGGRKARDGAAAPGDEVMGGAAPYELLNLPEPVSSADTNLTGHVSLSDFMAAAGRRFERLDTRSQGYFTLADLPKTPVQLAAEDRADQKGKP
jgi:hypothetical protein